MALMIWALMMIVKWSEHSYEVSAYSWKCRETLGEDQTSFRSYLLNGDKQFPQTMAERRAQAEKLCLELRDLVKDNASQSSRANGIIAAVDAWFDFAVANASRPVTDPTATIRVGDDLTAHLRKVFHDFTQAEQDLHAQRLVSVEQTKRLLGWAGFLLACLLAATVGQLVYRQFVGLAMDYESALKTSDQRHSELLRSEAELEEQKEWFKVTLSSIGDGVIVTDKEGRVIFMNHESERLTGWNSVEALLKPLGQVFRLVNEKTRQPVPDPTARVFAEQQVVTLGEPMVLVSRHGSEYPVEDSAAPIKSHEGETIGVVVVFHNASNERKAQAALRAHSEELEKRVAERTETLRQTVSELETFSYTVSHDLRSPLRAMQGFAQAVVEDYGDKLDDQGRDYLGRIKNAAERLDRLIQDLLSYTRLSRQDTPLVALDADKILRDIVDNYPNLHPPAAQVTIKGHLPRVQGHESALTQVFSNLLGNAVKFMPEGVVPSILVWAEDKPNRVRIFIEDNGIGVAPDDRERIFQMFVQINESQLYGGTGVGLAIVKKAVESMRGSVGVESVEEGGSRFWVELMKAS